MGLKPKLVVLFLAASTVLGCGTGPRTVHVGDTYSLDDSFLQLTVIPTGGRLISVSKRGVGGDNLLWTSPGSAQGWNNIGGDKSWVWPQDAWGTVEGLPKWPPAHAFDQAPFTLIAKGNHTIRAESPAFPLAGATARITREVKRLGRGKFQVTSRLESLDKPIPGEWAIWNIAQMPWPDDTKVSITGAKGTPSSLGQSPWPDAQLKDGVLILPTTGSGTGSAKAGIDGSAILYQTSSAQITLRVTRTSPGTRLPAESLQVYRSSPSDKNRYLELELTSPRRTITPGHPAELTVEWTVK